MFDRLRHLLLARWGRLTSNRPVLVLVLAVLLAAAAVGVTAQWLTFQADRNKLMSSDLPWNARFMRYADDFAGLQSLIVAVRVPEGEDGRARAEAFVSDLARRLQADDRHFEHIWYRIETSPELLRLAPQEEFAQRLEQIASSEPLLKAGSFGDLLARITSNLTATATANGSDEAAVPSSVEAIRHIERLIGIVGIIRGGAAGVLERSDLAALPGGGTPRWQYLESGDGELLFIQIAPRAVGTELEPYADAVAAAQRIVGAADAEAPEIEAGLTGLPVMEADESRLMMQDSTRASMVAAVAIAILLITAFRGWRLPAMMVFTLIIGVAWSFGFLTLAIGHLQLLSVFFTVILLGLGIDFGIHFVSAYERVRPRHGAGRAGCRAAIGQAMRTTGPGIVTGAFTTAVAFIMTQLTAFKGMAEMGLIAGVGVLLCMVAMLSVLPALLGLFDRMIRRAKRDGGATGSAAEGGGATEMTWVMPVVRRPGLVLSLAGIVVLLCAIPASSVSYDNNLIELYPEGLESVYWQEQIAEHSEAVWSAASITRDLDEARELTRRVRGKDTVQSVGGIGMLFPPNAAQRAERIEAVRQRLSEELEAIPPGDDGSPSAAALRQRLGVLSFGIGVAMNREEVRAEPEVRAALRRLRERIQQTLELLNQESFQADARERMARLHRLFTQWQRGARSRIGQALTAENLTPADLPDVLRRRSISRTEPKRYLLEVYPKHDIWEPANMEAFIRDLREVDPKITGVPVQVYESGRLIRQSFLFAGVLACVAVLVLVWLDFRSLADALLCLLPVGFGFVTMFGVMWLAGVSINPANIIVLPMLFGIGVASGVHMIHRDRQAPDARPRGLTGGTGKGVVLTSATTIIAFASMLLARHRGIQSLGFVLAVGLALTLLACLTILPAALELRRRE